MRKSDSIRLMKYAGYQCGLLCRAYHYAAIRNHSSFLRLGCYGTIFTPSLPAEARLHSCNIFVDNK
jgi:hypothetical protein